jgi:hypothetical protein
MVSKCAVQLLRPRGSVTLAAIATVGLTASLAAQPLQLGPPVSTWTPNGAVAALVVDGDTLYVGGNFDQVGPRTGSFGVVDAADANAVTTGAAVDTALRRVIADGSGGWYVATDPSFVPLEAGEVLHILPSGLRDPAWTSPTLDFNGVQALAADGGRLFIGGGFRTVNGVTRAGLAALDATTGALLPWDPQLVWSAPSGFPTIFAMAAIQGRLYIHGLFDQAGGAPRNRFAILDTATGSVLPGTLPASTVPPSIESILLTPTRVYFGGCFVGNQGICAYTSDLVPLAGWTATTPGPTKLIALGANRLYAVETTPTGPPFGTQVVALDADTGARLPFAPTVALGEIAWISSGAFSGNTLYVGGSFSQVNGQPRYRVAAVDATTGALLPWAPVVGGDVNGIATQGTAVALAGRFASAGGVRKRNLVALDLRTGQPGVPTPDSPVAVAALLRLGGVMVVGGGVLGAAGGGLAAFFTASGEPVPWSMPSNGEVSSLATDGSRLFVGGRFSLLGGVPRLNLASIDLGTAALTSWNPSPDGQILRLAVDGGTLFASGTYATVPGFARPGKIAFDAASGAVLPFNPIAPASFLVRGFGFHGLRVLMTGEQNAPGLAGPPVWVDRISGAVTPPTSNVSLRGYAAAQLADAIFLTGTDAPGATHLALVEAATGRISTTPIPLGFYPGALTVSPDYVAAGAGLLGFSSSAGLETTLVVYRSPRAGAPQRLTAAVANATVTLGWQAGAPPAATSFQVEAGMSFGATDVGVFGVGTATRVSGTLPPGTYFTRVRGVGTGGPGAASSEVIVTVPSTSTPPNAPGTLSASVAGGVVTLTWGAASGNATTYVIEAGTASGLANVGALPTGVLDTTFSTPAPSGTYFVRVRAANAFGQSLPSNEVTVVVP